MVTVPVPLPTSQPGGGRSAARPTNVPSLSSLYVPFAARDQVGDRQRCLLFIPVQCCVTLKREQCPEAFLVEEDNKLFSLCRSLARLLGSDKHPVSGSSGLAVYPSVFPVDLWGRHRSRAPGVEPAPWEGHTYQHPSGAPRLQRPRSGPSSAAASCLGGQAFRICKRWADVREKPFLFIVQPLLSHLGLSPHFLRLSRARLGATAGALVSSASSFRPVLSVHGRMSSGVRRPPPGRSAVAVLF